MLTKLQKLLTPQANTTTYTIGLLQAKAYRALKQQTTALLQEYKLNTLEWALIGHLSELSTEGMNSSEVAELLGVAPPFVTVLVKDLQKKKLLHKKRSPHDKRENRIFITEKGAAVVPEIEKKLRADFKAKLGVSALPHLHGYLQILTRLAHH